MAEAGADFIGLVFVEGTKRAVSITQAEEIIHAVRTRPGARIVSKPAKAIVAKDWFGLQSTRLANHPRRPLFVGVFQNPTLATLLSTIDELHLDAVQFHGSEPVEWARMLGVPVLRAFHVDSLAEEGTEEARLLNEATRPGYHSVAVLDTAVGSGKGALSGGAGKTFDWSVAKHLINSRGEGQDRLPIVLAGGLDASNVVRAIDQVQPWAIDVSGGVETDKVKDHAKIREFVRLVKTGE